MLQALAPSQGWTGRRKADLQQMLREILLDANTLRQAAVAPLDKAERAALAAVLRAGGAMPQADFRAAYGDDSEDSRQLDYKTTESVAGRLRVRGLLVETTVKKTVYLAIPTELRAPLAELLE